MLLKTNKEGLSDYLRSFEYPEGIVVSVKRKFIYLKPPKTAGTSILRHFLQKEVPDIIHQKDNPTAFNQWLKDITDAELYTYFIFTVVRNPWERFLSTATYFGTNLSDFINNFEKYNTSIDIKNHLRELYKYSKFRDNNFCDFIGRMENLQVDMNIVCDEIGVQKQILPFKNVSRDISKHYSLSYRRKKHISFVFERYGRDIELFGYSFIDVNQQQAQLKDITRKQKLKSIKKRIRKYLKFLGVFSIMSKRNNSILI